MEAQDTVPVGNGDLTAQLHRLTELVIDSQARNEARFDVLQAHIAPLSEEPNKLKVGATEIKADVIGLKGENVVVRSDVAILRVDVRELQKDVEFLRGQSLSHALDLVNVKADVVKLEDSVVELEAGH